MPEKILIVDDDTDSLKLISLMLQRHGYEIIAANNGTQALTKANADTPDLVILDVMMPDINGYEVCRRLRANPETQNVPIIMFTAKTLTDDKVAGFEAGADDYLTKPTHPAELAARVEAILQRSQQQRGKPNDNGGAIGILGAKGGLGTSTVTLNLGASLRHLSETPIIADFRLGAGTLGLMLGITQANGMANVLSKPVSEINIGLLEKELITHQNGLRALLSSIDPKEALLNYSPETAVAVVKGLRAIGKPNLYDLGSSYSPLVRRLCEEMDKIILLVEPVPLTLTLAKSLLRSISTDNADVTVVVVNRVQSRNQPSWSTVEDILQYKIGAIIAAAPEQMHHALEAYLPIVNHQPDAIITGQFNKLAETLTTNTEVSANNEISK